MVFMFLVGEDTTVEPPWMPEMLWMVYMKTRILRNRKRSHSIVKKKDTSPKTNMFPYFFLKRDYFSITIDFQWTFVRFQGKTIIRSLWDVTS